MYPQTFICLPSLHGSAYVEVGEVVGVYDSGENAAVVMLRTGAKIDAYASADDIMKLMHPDANHE